MMIFPTKHSNPDKTVIAVVFIILSSLKMKHSQSYFNLRALVRDRKCDALFIPAMDLLFLFGLINYYPQTDTFEFTGKKYEIK